MLGVLTPKLSLHNTELTLELNSSINNILKASLIAADTPFSGFKMNFSTCQNQFLSCLEYRSKYLSFDAQLDYGKVVLGGLVAGYKGNSTTRIHDPGEMLITNRIRCSGKRSVWPSILPWKPSCAPRFRNCEYRKLST